METTPRIFVIGSANMDLVLPVPRFPAAGETLQGGDLELHAGGKGANQACAAGRLGGHVYFAGCVGNDSFGERLTKSLRDAGVSTEHLRTAASPTGCASIYVTPEGQNSIVISPGANAMVTVGDVDRALAGLTSRDFVLLQLEIPMEAVLAALERAAEAGATSILDPAPARTLPAQCFALASILTPNETEAGTLAGEAGKDAATGELGERLRQRGAGRVILKLGDKGCQLFDGNEQTAVAGYRVTAVDTTAAGDVFNGALAVALAEGLTLSGAAQFANAAAALSVTKAGAQPSIPNRQEVDVFLQRQSNPGEPCLS